MKTSSRTLDSFALGRDALARDTFFGGLFVLKLNAARFYVPDDGSYMRGCYRGDSAVLCLAILSTLYTSLAIISNKQL